MKKLNTLWKRILKHKALHDIQGSSRLATLSSASFGSSRESSWFCWACSCRSSISYTKYDSEDDFWSSAAHDVPAGCLPVYVGNERRRYVIPTSYLSNSVFKVLLTNSEEEYGLRCEGGLRIACSADAFEQFLCWMEGRTTQ